MNEFICFFSLNFCSIFSTFLIPFFNFDSVFSLSYILWFSTDMFAKFITIGMKVIEPAPSHQQPTIE